jgi:hypothetical protein
MADESECNANGGDDNKTSTTFLATNVETTKPDVEIRFESKDVIMFREASPVPIRIVPLEIGDLASPHEVMIDVISDMIFNYLHDMGWCSNTDIIHVFVNEDSSATPNLVTAFFGCLKSIVGNDENATLMTVNKHAAK